MAEKFDHVHGKQWLCFEVAEISCKYITPRATLQGRHQSALQEQIVPRIPLDAG